jgi:hypothetical protein
MKRAIFTIFIACVLAGCKSSTPTVDPFFGRTTIPPPPTGAVSGQPANPYYQAQPALQPSPAQPPGLQAPAYQPPAYSPQTYNNPSRTSTNATSPPTYAGSASSVGSVPTNSTNNQAYSRQTTAPAYSLSSNLLTAPYLLQSTPQNTAPQNVAPQYTAPQNPALLSPASQNLGSQNYSGNNTQPTGVPPITSATQPSVTSPSMTQPTSQPGTSPAGNLYTPPSGSYNYRGTSNDTPNYRPAAASSTRISTPYFAGGVPNRTTAPLTDSSPRPIDNTVGNTAGQNLNTTNTAPAYSPAAYQPGSYLPSGSANSTNASVTGQTPIVQTLQPQSGSRPYSQGNNYTFPASQRYIQPAQAQTGSDSAKPTWRESDSSDSRVVDENIKPASNTEAKAGNE